MGRLKPISGFGINATSDSRMSQRLNQYRAGWSADVSQCAAGLKAPTLYIML
jgi:hypothetical protein